ncbi:MAG: tyrosine-type recombinase/integrase [Thiothrix sp.]|uniref:tyrosine-type recombinase/integrase n=1 Tax=Thiothrix sp. TaxID=1032 RepID=UPI0026258527|nr:site-specific integrase [Thiothrix sp.]MDD5394605.1 tyrosine-type recombinase/integrase [Thiothrix sp.]
MLLESLEDLLALYVRERDPSEAMERQLGVVLRSFRGFSKVSRLEEIRRDNLIDWRNHLLKKRKVSVATWNNYLRHIKVLFNFAKENGWGDGQCLKGIKRLPEQKRRKRTVSEDEIGQVLVYLRHPDQQFMPGWFWETVCKALYYSGIRRRQLVGLLWQDIDWCENTVRLCADTSKTRTEWLIPMVSSLQEILVELKGVMEHKLGRRCLPTEQIFNVTLFNPNYKAKNMMVDHVSAAFRRVREQTGVNVSAHCFRHTFASQLAKQGRIKELQQVMGHTDVRTTLGYVQPDMKGMAELLSGLANI